MKKYRNNVNLVNEETNLIAKMQLGAQPVGRGHNFIYLNYGMICALLLDNMKWLLYNQVGYVDWEITNNVESENDL